MFLLTDDDVVVDDDDDNDDGGGGVIGKPMYYHKSKNLNVSALRSLQKNAKFNDVEVDTDVSTIHVPTHVYEECTYVASHLLIT